jgi:hypothetical protein
MSLKLNISHNLFINLCRRCVDFSLQCAWLLEAYCVGSKKKSQGSRLRTLILSGELVPDQRGHQTAWRTSYRGHKCPAVTPRAPQPDLLTAPRPHEFHTQVEQTPAGKNSFVHED